jgi:hypothetical protein
MGDLMKEICKQWFQWKPGKRRNRAEEGEKFEPGLIVKRKSVGLFRTGGNPKKS